MGDHMSHNRIKVGTAAPNSAGQISATISDLSDVTLTSPTSNQVLTFNGTQWTNTSTSTLGGGTVLFVGDGSATAYPTGGTALASGVDLHFYAVVYNGVNATVGSGWINSITLPAGSYLINAVAGISFSSSTGIATYRCYDQANYFGSVGNVAYDTDTVGSSASGYISSASSLTISIRLTAVTDVNTLAAQGTRQAEFGYIEVRLLE